MDKKKKSNKSGYPDEAIKTLARCFYPSMVEFFNSEEGQREYGFDYMSNSIREFWAPKSVNGKAQNGIGSDLKNQNNEKFI